MPNAEWFRVTADSSRVSFYTVHWSTSKRLTLPYASVTFMATMPGERFVIEGLGLRIEGQFVKSRKRTRRELADDRPARSLEEFQEAFADMRLRGVFDQPAAGMNVRVYRRTEDGWEDFVF